MSAQRKLPLFPLAVLPLTLAAAFAHADGDTVVEGASLDTVYVTAEKQLQQSLGVSRISTEDIEKRPAVNDISELVRTMPGVNLTGNTATGQRGNKRQIDLRGMGPENTLILIDGKPVHSRQSERISMRGERNTRGDSNWVPVEEIESITVLRGPAATRYGSGAMGGVVNIVTKKVPKEFKGSVNYYTNQPQDSKEGATNRVGFNLGGPIIQDVLGFRIYGNFNKTDADSTDINRDSITTLTTQNGPIRERGRIVVPAGQTRTVTNTTYGAAGVEGVKNKDIAGRLQWKISPSQTLIFDSDYSRQGNIYNGDSQNSNAANTRTVITDTATGAVISDTESTLREIYRSGIKETARLYRASYALTHDGAWDWGDTKNVLSYERTTNSHLPEGLAGGPEGSYVGTEYVQSRLKNLRFSSEHTVQTRRRKRTDRRCGIYRQQAGRSLIQPPRLYRPRPNIDLPGRFRHTRRQNIAAEQGNLCRRQYFADPVHQTDTVPALRPQQQKRRQLESRAQLLPADWCKLAGQRWHRARLQSPQPVPKQSRIHPIHAR